MLWGTVVGMRSVHLSKIANIFIKKSLIQFLKLNYIVSPQWSKYLSEIEYFTKTINFIRNGIEDFFEYNLFKKL